MRMAARNYEARDSGDEAYRFMILSSDSIPVLYLNSQTKPTATNPDTGNLLFKLPMTPLQTSASWAIKS